MRVTAAVRRPGPCPGPVRVTVANDQGIHPARPVHDRHALAPPGRGVAIASASRLATVRQRCPGVLRRGVDLCVRLVSQGARAQEHSCHCALYIYIYMDVE